MIVQLPSGTTTNILKPKPGASQQERQQAVVWLGQDVYTGFLALAEGRRVDGLTIVKMWRDVIRSLNDQDAMDKIQAILISQVGVAGLAMLG